MSERVPAVASVAATAAVVKKPKKVPGGSKACKPVGPSVTELITKAVSVSKERKGLSVAALKKVLAAGGYDVEKNNSRIKLGLKSLVGKGTLVQTKGIGASGSFRLSKKTGEVKVSKKRVVAAKPKKPAAKKPVSAAKPKKVLSAKKSPKKAKKPAASAVKKVAKSPKKVTKAVKPRKAAVVKSLAKAKAVKSKATKEKKAASKKK